METDLVALNQKIAVMEQQRGHTAQHFFTKGLSDKLLLRRANGKLLGKADFLQSLQAPSPFTLYSVEQLEIAQLAEVEKRLHRHRELWRLPPQYGQLRVYGCGWRQTDLFARLRSRGQCFWHCHAVAVRPNSIPSVWSATG